MKSTLGIHTSDPDINRRLYWACSQALDYALSNSPIGPVYEAALPGRNAFCMRDVSHQAIGAHALSLSPHNLNMMSRFVNGISESKDYCTFWEIMFDGTPCPVDYNNDKDFWYNLPANFDLVDACLRLYKWTGDLTYLSDHNFVDFHRMSVREYVRRWDRDRDGIVDSKLEDGRRGVGSYDESPRQAGFKIAADTLASQIAAFKAYAAILELSGSPSEAREYLQKSEQLIEIFENDWWSESLQAFASVCYGERDYGYDYMGMNAMMPLYFNIINDENKRQAQLKYIMSHSFENVEEGSYYPEVLWKHGLNQQAMTAWLHMTEPTLSRREYPEVSFTAIGAFLTGFMGLHPDASKSALCTSSAVPDGMWAQVEGLPLWGGSISVIHKGSSYSEVVNRTGRSLNWYPSGITEAIIIPSGMSSTYERT